LSTDVRRLLVQLLQLEFFGEANSLLEPKQAMPLLL
jgi:hypothetical protein